jgi:hypothetical protein
MFAITANLAAMATRPTLLATIPHSFGGRIGGLEIVSPAPPVW